MEKGDSIRISTSRKVQLDTGSKNTSIKKNITITLKIEDIEFSPNSIRFKGKNISENEYMKTYINKFNEQFAGKKYVDIEFFDDEIESIRYFDSASQKSIENVESIKIFPYSEFISDKEIFEEKEIEKEKDVVIEEINSYRDAPADLIYDEFEERFFAGHTLAHNILGSKRGVRSFSSESLRHFMRTHYTTDRMVISVVGDVDFGRVVRLCEKHFQSSGPVEREVERAVLPVPVTPFSISLNRRTHQMHVLIGYEAPHTYDDRKVAFTLLNNILGGPAMNSRLNVAIRERYGFCYTIESQYTPLSDTGLFYIYAGIDPLSYDKFMELVEIQLRGVAERELSPSMLRAAQQQLIGQMAISGESAQGEMQSMGKALMTYGRVETLEEMRDDVLSISAGELRSVAERYFFSGRKGTLIYS